MPLDQVEHVGAVLGSPRAGAAEDFFGAITESATLPAGIEVGEATAAVTCALLARLDLEPARQVLDALPPAVAGGIGRCPIHGGAAGEAFGASDFFGRIAAHLQVAPEAIRPMAAAVLHALRAQLPPHVIRVVERQLPRELVALWRGGARS